MAVGAYTKKTWANRPSTSTAINAANLQTIDDQIQNITDAIVSGGANPTKVWTSTNDGNAGQPPAPKPNGNGIAKNSLGVGQSVMEDVANGGTTTWPSCGGTALLEVQTYGATINTVSWYIHAADGSAIGGNANASLRIKWTRIIL